MIVLILISNFKSIVYIFQSHKCWLHLIIISLSKVSSFSRHLSNLKTFPATLNNRSTGALDAGHTSRTWAAAANCGYLWQFPAQNVRGSIDSSRSGKRLPLALSCQHDGLIFIIVWIAKPTSADYSYSEYCSATHSTIEYTELWRLVAL